MDSFKVLLRRSDEEDDALTPTMVGLLIALMGLVVLGMVCIGALLVLKRLRSRRDASLGLPTHHTSSSMAHLHASPSTRRGHRRTLTITSTLDYSAAPRAPSYHDSEKAAFMAAEQSPPGTPHVPEIHITFPEDKGEKRCSRVVVVKITDSGNVGLEPYHEKGGEQLPQYEARGEKGDEWRSLDIEKLGGLKEKDEKRWG